MGETTLPCPLYLSWFEVKPGLSLNHDSTSQGFFGSTNKARGMIRASLSQSALLVHISGKRYAKIKRQMINADV